LSEAVSAENGSIEDEALAFRELVAQIYEAVLLHAEQHHALVFVDLSADRIFLPTLLGGCHIVVLRFEATEDIEVAEPASLG
jgi:hypothetical protein